MAWGNGAFVVHKLLEKHLVSYKVSQYHPYLTLIPFFIRYVVQKPAPSDIIHTVPDYAIFSRTAHNPLVVSLQNYVLDPWMGRYSSFFQRIHYRTDLRWFVRKAVERADAITAVSKFTRKLVQQDLGVKKNIKLIHNAVNTEMFTPAKTKKYTDEIKIFFAGNLTSRKGAHWLKAIADKLDRKVCIHYTQGLRTRNSLPAHERLRPVGPISFNDMPQRYKEMDILLMPTVREGFSLAVLEAMASGLPVVASDCSSLPEQIDADKGGFLCPVGDVSQFAERINLLADSPEMRKEMGFYNRSKTEKYFTLQKMVNLYKELFESIMEQRLNRTSGPANHP